MFDNLIGTFVEKAINNGNYTVLFISIGVMILFAGIKYLCKRIHGIDDISLKKADVKFTDLERTEKILDKLKQNSNSVFRRKAYEFLFNKSVPYIEIEYLDWVMKYKDPVKSFRCLVSTYFYIDKTIKNEIKEKKYDNFSWIRNLKPRWVYILGYFIFAMGSLLVLSISPAYLYKDFLKNAYDIDLLWLLLLSYFIASIAAVPMFCIAKVMLDKSLAVNDLKWLSDKSNLEVNEEKSVKEPCNNLKIRTSSEIDELERESNTGLNFMNKLKKIKFW